MNTNLSQTVVVSPAFPSALKRFYFQRFMKVLVSMQQTDQLEFPFEQLEEIDIILSDLMHQGHIGAWSSYLYRHQVS